MLSSNVPRGQRNWNKLCGWNVRANKEGYTRGMSTMTPFRTYLNLLIICDIIDSMRIPPLIIHSFYFDSGFGGFKGIWQLPR